MRGYFEQSDPDKNPQFRRMWLPPPKRRRGAPGQNGAPSKTKTSSGNHIAEWNTEQALARRGAA